MPNYFLDTSALAKRYHKENGSDFVDRILLAIKTRSREIDQQALEIARRRFRADLVQKRLLVGPQVQEIHFQRARRLLGQFGVTEGLRTLNALQLAVALDLYQSGSVAVLVAPDQRLCRVSTLAGCPAVNPEQPGPMVG